MPDLRCDEVREFFDLMGALPDLFVPDATVQDWQAILDLVATSGWQWQYEEGSTVLSLLAAATVLARPAGAEIAQLRVWPVPGVLAIVRFMSETEISFDVDLRELQGQEGIDTLCAFLQAIGSGLGKPVLMTPEGGSPALELASGNSSGSDVVRAVTCAAIDAVFPGHSRLARMGSRRYLCRGAVRSVALRRLIGSVAAPYLLARLKDGFSRRAAG